jgi:hypothetical protein
MSKKRRKVIQIATASDPDNTIIVALCNDGSIWKLWGGTNWRQVDTSKIEGENAAQWEA